VSKLIPNRFSGHFLIESVIRMYACTYDCTHFGMYVYSKRDMDWMEKNHKINKITRKSKERCPGLIVNHWVRKA
jgi:hypothetical protein